MLHKPKAQKERLQVHIGRLKMLEFIVALSVHKIFLCLSISTTIQVATQHSGMEFRTQLNLRMII
jgi:hypothetical protein